MPTWQVVCDDYETTLSTGVIVPTVGLLSVCTKKCPVLN